MRRLPAHKCFPYKHEHAILFTALQAQVAELKEVKGDAEKFEECARKAHELLAEGEKLRVKMDPEMEALRVREGAWFLPLGCQVVASSFR